MQNYLWQAIKDTAKSAIVGMDYIKSLAKIVNTYQNYIEWLTPTDFLVRQEYQDTKKSEIKTEMFGNILRSRITTLTSKTDKQKQINGICPNFIHSMDSACLMKYLLKSNKAGITSFTSVHDCYGTLAPDTELSAQLLREAFIDVYRQPILDYLEYDLLDKFNLTPENIPKKPEQGELEINEVLQSQYFFN